MASFCWGCAGEEFDTADRNDFKGIAKPGGAVGVLCEGCGDIWVDHEGKRVPAATKLPERQDRHPESGRGLGFYGDNITDEYHDRTDGMQGCVIQVQDSSSAGQQCCWLRLKGEAHLRGKPRAFAGIPFGIAQGNISAHLTETKAREVHAALGAWLQTL